jgi:peroxiredoxin
VYFFSNNLRLHNIKVSAMTLFNSKFHAPNFTLVLPVICLLLTVFASRICAEDAEQFKAKLRQTAEMLFSSDVAEYKAFSQNLGDSLVTTAGAMLALSDLTPDDQRFALLMKYWGLVRKYGFDRNELNGCQEGFAASIEDLPGMTDLYKTIMENLYFSSQNTFYDIDDPREKVEAFIRHRDRFYPFMEKYCAEEDNRQLTYIMGQVMQSCDNDGAFGLVESTVEKLLPLLKKQEQSLQVQSNSKMVQGMAHRVQLTGKEMKYEGVSTTGELIDMKNFRGKVVFLNFDHIRNNVLEIHKKLYDAFHDSGLIVITHDSMESREVVRKKAEDDGIPWIITCRRARYEKNLEDYYQNWGLTRALFLIDRDGIVIRSWSKGFCPAACDELKKLFPEKEDVLSEIAAELVQQEQDMKNERATWREKSPNPTANELDEMMTAVDSAVAPQGNPLFPDVLTPSIVSQTRLELADVLGKTPELTLNQRQRVMNMTLDSLQDSAMQKLKKSPETPPEEAYRELNLALDKFEKSPDAAELRNIFFGQKLRQFFDMTNYLKDRAAEKTGYARHVQKWWFNCVEKEIVLYRQLPKEKRNPVILSIYVPYTNILIDAMEEIDENGSLGLVVSLCDEFLPLLENCGIYELEEYAERLKGIARRSGSVGKEFDFECVLMNGETINVRDLRGKIVLVNFWATWCGPCIREFPNMKTQYEKYKDKGYEMIALSTDADVETIVRFQQENDYPWLVGSLTKSRDAELVNYHAFYGIQGIPTTFLLDRDGKVIFRMVGSDDERFNRELEKAFGK